MSEFIRFRYKLNEKVYTTWRDEDKTFVGSGIITSRRFKIKYLDEKKETAWLIKEYEWTHKSKDRCFAFILTEEDMFRNEEDAKKKLAEAREHLIEFLKQLEINSSLNGDNKDANT